MLLTKSKVFIIGPIATLLGFIINAIYISLHGVCGIENISICIILFTIIVNIAMLPLTIKQQKSSKMMNVMNPELQAIQKKYKGKTDQASQMKMMEEQRAVQAKYGVSMSGSCVTMLIQMPILFAMYQVIWKIPAYVSSVYKIYGDLAGKLLTTTGAQEFLTEFASTARVDFTKTGFTENTIVDVLYNLRPENWTALAEKFTNLDVMATYEQTKQINNFLGINIADAPMSIIRSGSVLAIIVAIAIPVLAGLTQWLNTKLMPTSQSDDKNGDNTVASSMKTMNTVMPLMSVFFCFTFSTGIGIYWVASSAVRCVIQVIVNKQMDKMDIDEMVKKNMEKYNEKRAKQGLRPEQISVQAKQNLKNIKTDQNVSEETRQQQREKRIKSIQESTAYYNNTAKPGSLAAKARMVQQYNEKNAKGGNSSKKK
ncbi:MAG: YidC/Oxa1 family membrane protein insertase [Eubacteriales bacterium]|nr:YidC/Oxa1 family membrane protein insertase [Eubacteriales bacterium]